MKTNYYLLSLILVLLGFNAQSQLTAPFTESFNSTTLPSTWTQGAGSGGPWVLGGTMGYAASTIGDHTGVAGSVKAWMDFSGFDDSVTLTSDTIDVSALTNPELSFWVNSNLGTNVVTPLNYLLVEAFDTSNTWVVVDTIQNDHMGVWTEYYFALTPYVLPGNKLLIRVRAESGGHGSDFFHDIAIDDITVAELSPCRAPLSLSSKAITTNSATLTWMASPSADTAWSVEYGTLGFTLGSGTYMNASADSLNISSLSPATNYSFYVRGYCTSGDTSVWSGPHSFLTLCTVDTIPYLMDYTAWPPLCWDLTGGANQWVSATSATGVAEANFWGISSGNFLMTSGAIHVNAHSRVKFDWSHLYSATYPLDSMEVQIKIDTAASWTRLWGFAGPALNSNDGAANTSPGTFKTEVINLDSATYMNKDVLIRVVAVSGFGPDLFVDNVILEEIPSCPEPTSLSHHALFSDSVALNWVNGLADSIWQIQYGTTGFGLGTGTIITDPNDSISVGGLTPQTTYDVYLRSICKVGDSSIWVGPYTFTTPCSFYTPPYSENFSTYTFSVLPTCWEEAKGQLTVSSSVIIGPSNWGNRANFANNGLGNPAAVMNIFSTNRFEWLISPSIDLGTGTIPYQVEFDVAITDYFNASPPSAAGGLMGPDDKLVLVISPDNGVTWSDTNILEIWDTSNMPSHTGDYFAYNLTAAGYTGQVKFGLYAETTISNEDNDAFIDNFAVVQVPTCPRPLKLTFDSATTTTANVSWTNGANDSTWILEYGAPGFTLGTGTTTTSTTNPATITGLTHSTCYDVYLRSFCDVADTSLWIGPLRFCTDCAPVVDLCEDFEGYNANELPICWNSFIASTGTGPTVGIATFGAFSGTNAVRMNSGFTTGSTLFLISPEMTALNAMSHRISFWANSFSDTMLVVGTMTDPANPATFTPWDTIFDITSTYQRYRIPFDTYAGTDKHIAFLYTPTSTFNSMNIDEFCFEEIPSCEKAPFVTVLNPGQDSTEIRLGWNVDTTQDTFLVAYGPSGYDPVTNPAGGDTSITTITLSVITGLTPQTEYCFWVKAICKNGDTSFWDGPHCAFTGCGSSYLPYSENFDSYNDAFPRDETPQCWEEATGTLDVTGNISLNTESVWTEDGFANVGFTGAARINFSAFTSREGWLVTPSFNFGSDPNVARIIEFDVALTEDFNTNAAPNGFGDDDTVAFVVSYDEGITWKMADILIQWDTSNEPSHTGTRVTYTMRNTTGKVRFGFYGVSNVNNEGVDFFVDSFSIRDTTWVGIDEVNNIGDFKVFPNPNTGLFNITNEGNALQSNIKVLDIQGRIVYEEAYFFNKNGRKQIDISSFNAGVYVLMIQSEGKLEQHRILISK